VTNPRADQVRISFFDGEAEEMELTNVLISGLSEKTGKQQTVYLGDNDLNALHTALFFINRSIARVLRSEFNMSEDDMDIFLMSATNEAITAEFNMMRPSSEISKRIADAVIQKMAKKKQ
jgi:hypothetical protein